MIKRMLIFWFFLCYGGESSGDCSIVPKDLPSPRENLFSQEHDVKLGQEFFAQTASNWMDKERGRKAEVIEDELTNAYLKSIVGRLLIHAPEYAKGYDYRFYLVKSKPFEDAVMQALPGGIILVSHRSILDAPSDDYLAGIIAHEMGHIVLRHTSRTLTVKRLFEVEEDALFAPKTSNKEEIVGEKNLLMNEFIQRRNKIDDDERRMNEFDADVWGSRIVHSAGFSLTSLIARSAFKASFEANTYSDGSKALPNAIRTMILSCENGTDADEEHESDALNLTKVHIRNLMGE